MPGSFFSSYVKNTMRADEFIPSGFGDAAARAAAVARAASRSVSPSLLAELAEQHARLPASASRRRALDDLARAGTVAVVTGQQVGLFLGPLYTIYKAATAVVLARALAAETGVRAVPIFWLATEDHDFAEIDHCVVARAGGEPLRLRVDGDGRSDGRQPVARVRLGAAVSTAVEAVAEALRGRPAGAEVAALLRECYQPERTFGEAFAALLATLFADEGLIVFDPRRPAVAQLAARPWRTALERAPAIVARLAERDRALGAAGLAAQVSLRPDSALVFHHGHHGGSSDDGDGPRQLVRAAEAGRLVAELERAPMRFSSSALLRPIVQDSLFPSAAYVGGPAEVSYLAQSAALYDLFDLPVPLVAPRARFRLVDARTRGRLKTLGLAPADLEAPRDALLQRLGATRTRPSPAELRARLWSTPAAELAALAAPLAALDPGLGRALDRTRATVERAIERLLGRYARAAAIRDGEAVAALDRARALVYPDDAPQERVFAFPSFAADAGPRAFIRAIVAAVDPFDPRVRDLDA